MSILKSFISFLIDIVRFHKKKVFLCFSFCCIFTVLLFPYNELGEALVNQIAKTTNNQVFIKFKELKIIPLPSPSLIITDVQVDTPSYPSLKIGALKITPLIKDLFLLKPGIVVQANNLFKGKMKMKLIKGRSEKGSHFQNFQLGLANIEMQSLIEYASLSLPLQGKLNLSIMGEVDPSFKQEPKSQFKMNIQKFHLPSSNFYGMATPTLNFSTVNLLGALNNSEIYLKKMDLGTENEDINGSLRGKLGLQLASQGKMQPQPGPFELYMKLNVKDHITQNSTINLVLSFIEKFKKTSSDQHQYLLKLSGSSFRTTPQIEALSQF